MGRQTVWHPFTQHGVEPVPTQVRRARGAWIETADNRRLFDAISSWWVITHGHRHPKIVDAIKEQADRMDQVIFAGLSHEPADRLGEKLVELAPEGLDHVFYSDSGSTAVEVALKMALGYWHNTGHPRTRIAALDHSYHGDTIGTMSPGERGIFNASYQPLLFDVVRIPFPFPGKEEETFAALRAAGQEDPLAALIVEPLVAGAGGMLMYSPDALREMCQVVRRDGTLFIADEVMTGWGRTGTLFACEQAAVTPDILCTAKGLTGGSVPLAATLSTAAIFDAHVSEDRAKTFFHSSSFTANPICCAAAQANIEIWESEPVEERITALTDMQRAGLASLQGAPHFSNHRQVGTIAAFDLTVPDGGYLAEAGLRLRTYFLEHGILARPLGNTIYVMPPYCTRPDELEQAYRVIRDAANAVLT